MSRGTHGAALVAAATLVMFSEPQAAAGRQSVLDRPARLEVVGVPLSEALSRLGSASGVSVAFSPDLTASWQSVTCHCTDATVGDALVALLQGTGMRFSRRGLRVLVTPALGGIAGVVMDRAGAPVKGVEVQVAGAAASVVTDEEGGFSLLDLDEGRYTVQTNARGWSSESRPVDVAFGAVASVTIALEPLPIPLAGIVVTPGTFAALDPAATSAPVTLTREQIETQPQLGEDVLRSLQRLPGVVVDGVSARLNVRGATDREVLLRLDGLDLVHPYHMPDLDGAFSILDVAAIGGIDVMSGGFPARYGDRLAGIVEMHSRSPPARGSRTAVTLSIMNVGVLSQGAFAEGRGDWLVSARRGYADVALALLGSTDWFSPRYFDVFGKAEALVGSKNRIAIRALAAEDRLSYEDAEGEDRLRLSTRWINRAGWLTWTAFPGARTRVETVLAVGRSAHDRAGDGSDPSITLGAVEGALRDDSDLTFSGVRHEWTLDLTDRAALRFGGEWWVRRAAYDYWSWSLSRGPGGESIDTTNVDQRPTGSTSALHVTARMGGPTLAGEAGVRVDRVGHTEESYVSPRLGLTAKIGGPATLRAAWGIYRQAHGLDGLQVGDGESDFQPSERASQLSAGLEATLGSGLTARLEAYRRWVRQPLRRWVGMQRELVPFPELAGDRLLLDPDAARARGLELFVEARRRGWESAVTYVLASTEDRVGGDWVPRALDQRHSFRLLGSYRPGPAWIFSAGWQFHSGWPFTPHVLQADTTQAEATLAEGFGPYNSVRLPPYHRLDIRVTRQFDTRRGQVQVYLDLFNAYNRRNLRGLTYVLGATPDGRPALLPAAGQAQLPLLPSFGVRWVW